MMGVANILATRHADTRTQYRTSRPRRRSLVQPKLRRPVLYFLLPPHCTPGRKIAKMQRNAMQRNAVPGSRNRFLSHWYGFARSFCDGSLKGVHSLRPVPGNVLLHSFMWLHIHPPVSRHDPRAGCGQYVRARRVTFVMEFWRRRGVLSCAAWRFDRMEAWVCEGAGSTYRNERVTSPGTMVNHIPVCRPRWARSRPSCLDTAIRVSPHWCTG